MEHRLGWTHALLALVLVLSLALSACTESDEDDDVEEQRSIEINGVDFTTNEIFTPNVTTTITGSDDIEYTGSSLSSIVDYPGMASRDSQFRITASDGYSKVVTWGDMERGILVQDDLMTVFPDLPGKYRIRDVVSIHGTDVDTILVNDRLYVTGQPFDIFAFELVNETVENETFEGVRPSDLLNHSGLVDGGQYNYTLRGSDGYNRTVNWTMMMDGVLVEEGTRIVFPELETGYWVSEIVVIEVI